MPSKFEAAIEEFTKLEAGMDFEGDKLIKRMTTTTENLGRVTKKANDKLDAKDKAITGMDQMIDRLDKALGGNGAPKDDPKVDPIKGSSTGSSTGSSGSAGLSTDSAKLPPPQVETQMVTAADVGDASTVVASQAPTLSQPAASWSGQGKPA